MNKKNAEKHDDENEKFKHSISELTDTLQRLQADFENYKKRVDKEKAQIAVMTKAAVLQQLLPIIDAFEIAAKSTEGEQLKKGMALIHTELAKVMASLDMKPIASVGHRCDPHKHEVLMQEQRKDCEDDTIIEELQKGYTVGNFIVRTSKVKVTKKIADKEEQEKHETNPQKHTAQ